MRTNMASRIYQTINDKDPWQLFKLFWTDELIDKLIEYTNRNAELHPPLEDAQFPRR